MSEVRLILNVLIYRDDEWWVAHCLETDVVAEGDSPSKAFENLRGLTEYQIETALSEGDLESIFRPAPAETQRAFASAYDRPFRRRPPQAVERFNVRELQPT
jgi:predicted RNase H-like HicB family nuclease